MTDNVIVERAEMAVGEDVVVDEVEIVVLATEIVVVYELD
jgi:hypothetical protein